MAKECPHRFHLPKKQRGCIQHECEFYIHLVGINPQTGHPTDEWGCSMRWLPILMTEQTGKIQQSTASVDKVATEVRKARGMIIGAMPEEARERLLSAEVKLLDESAAPK